MRHIFSYNLAIATFKEYDRFLVLAIKKKETFLKNKQYKFWAVEKKHICYSFCMNLEKYNAACKKIIDLLEKNSIDYKYFEHAPVRTSEEAAKVRSDYSLSQGAKALIIRIKNKDR